MSVRRNKNVRYTQMYSNKIKYIHIYVYRFCVTFVFYHYTSIKFICKIFYVNINKQLKYLMRLRFNSAKHFFRFG